MDLSYVSIEDRIRNMMQFGIDLSVKIGNLKCFFSLVKIGFLIMRVIIRTREKDVFIEAKNWLREKTRLPFEIADPRFHSVARPQNESRENMGNIGGFIRQFHDRRLRPPFEIERIKSP